MGKISFDLRLTFCDFCRCVPENFSCDIFEKVWYFENAERKGCVRAQGDHMERHSSGEIAQTQQKKLLAVNLERF